MKNTTLYEISKILKLSPSTVSRALKNHPDIAPETKARILEVAKKLDYVPNLFAVSLRKDSSREIGIIVPNLSGMFYENFISSVEEEAKKFGYSLMILLSGNDPDIEIQCLKTCKQRRLDAVMLCLTETSQNTNYFKALQQQGLPLIFFDKVPEMEEANTVCVADVQATEMAVRALYSKPPLRALAIFGSPSLSITKNRYKAYQETVTEMNDTFQHRTEYVSNSEEAKTQALDFLKHGGPGDAIFCMSDEILVGVMKAIQMLSRSVPDEVSVVAISNGFFPTLYFPEITFVETSAYKLGKLTFNRTMELIKGDKSSKNCIGESILVPGGSLCHLLRR